MTKVNPEPEEARGQIAALCDADHHTWCLAVGANLRSHITIFDIKWLAFLAALDLIPLPPPKV